MTTPTTTTTEPRTSLFFADATACKEWLNGLAHGQPTHALSVILDALRVFNRATTFEPMERLKCLELLRDKVAFLQAEQRAAHFARTIPLVAPEAAAWTNGRMVLEEMEAGYRQCAGAAGLEAHAALIAQRVVRYIGAQIHHHAFVYRRFDSALWSRLHQQFALAENGRLAGQSVKDSVEGEEGVSSVEEAYVRAILLEAARLGELDGRGIGVVEALARLWAGKVRVATTPGEDADAAAPLPLVVDLLEPRGAFALDRAALRASHRVLDVSSLSRSIRRRVRALKGGEMPVNLGLPPAACAIDPLPALQRLYRLWCDGSAAPPAGKPSAEKSAGLAFGASEIHFFLAQGKPFEQPDRERELSRQEKDDLAVFGRVTQRTQSMMLHDQPAVTLEAWDIVEEMAGAWRLRRTTAGKPLAIGRLVGVRAGATAPIFAGYVSELLDEGEGHVSMTVALLPGRPEPVAVRAGDARARGHAPWSPGFRLPAFEKIGVPVSLVVPAATAVRGRGLQSWEEGVRDHVVQEVLHAGADFDRVTLAPA